MMQNQFHLVASACHYMTDEKKWQCWKISMKLGGGQSMPANERFTKSLYP